MFEWLRRLFGGSKADRPGTMQPAAAHTESRRGLDAPAPTDIATEVSTDRPDLAPAPVAVEPKPVAPAAMPLLDAAVPERVLFVDVETTGLGADDRIVSLGAILLDTPALANGKLEIEWAHLVFDPGRKSHPRAEAVHGWSDWVLRHQEFFGEGATTISNLFEKAELVVAHNAEFDMDFISAEFADCGVPLPVRPVYCTMQGHRRLSEGSASLNAVARHLGLARAGARHGALEDAWLAMMIYLAQHGARCTTPFSAIQNPGPSNLRPVPPLPDGPMPRRKRRPRAKRLM